MASPRTLRTQISHAVCHFVPTVGVSVKRGITPSLPLCLSLPPCQHRSLPVESVSIWGGVRCLQLSAPYSNAHILLNVISVLRDRLPPCSSMPAHIPNTKHSVGFVIFDDVCWSQNMMMRKDIIQMCCLVRKRTDCGEKLQNCSW